MPRRLAIACALVFAAPMQCAAREPTADEQEDVANKLLSAGYLRWGLMEKRGDWVVEGVYRSNGEICDLKVRFQTLEIFDEDCD
jgi:hypothetical protein